MRQALPVPQRVMAVVLSVLFVFCPFAAHAAGESDTAADPVLLPIIMYHEVKPNKSGKDAIQPWEFEADLKWLADNGYTTIVNTLFFYIYMVAMLSESGSHHYILYFLRFVLSCRKNQ